MAKAELASPFAGMSGKSGRLVFRRLRGETIIAQSPSGKPRKPSSAQNAQRERFACAAAYARQVLSDPLRRRVYEALAKERNRRADKLVISDYLTPPVVEEIDVSGYQRQPGGLIRILATDDIEVVSVHVAIRASAGALIEQGLAAKTHGLWHYTATALAPVGPLTITATAQDRPGHEGMRTVVCA